MRLRRPPDFPRPRRPRVPVTLGRGGDCLVSPFTRISRRKRARLRQLCHDAPAPKSAPLTDGFSSPDGGLTLDPGSERVLSLHRKGFRQPQRREARLRPATATSTSALGDGGGGDDPERNGQDRTRLLGKILRIDVDSEVDDAPYRSRRTTRFPASALHRRQRAEMPNLGARPSAIRGAWLRSPTGRPLGRRRRPGRVGGGRHIEHGGNYGWDVREGHCSAPAPARLLAPPDYMDPSWIQGASASDHGRLRLSRCASFCPRRAGTSSQISIAG